jgi:uncharacterized protein
VRHAIRDVKTLQRLALYLVSNTGKLVTANRLKTLFEVGSTNTITQYLSYLEETYLLHLVPKFSYSIRKQIVNPRKAYVVDTGMISVNSGSFTQDSGRKLENLVFLHLRRNFRDIYYFYEKRECDFIVVDKSVPNQAVQVCYDLNPDNLDRELEGLQEAMAFFSMIEGVIVTLDQKDNYEKDGMIVRSVPAHEYMSS